MNATITLKEYIDKKKTFVIPDYQRGYVWGKNREGEKNSVDNLLDDLIVRFEGNTDVFLQGFTVTENRNEIIIIDGQQRTTCLYLLLKWLGYDGEFNIQYRIRQESNNYLRALNFNDIGEDKNEVYQDIYFFKKTLRIISSKLENIDKNSFMEFLLSKVRFLYINVVEEKAPRVFTMMNGSKAEMRQEEIVKAEILRLASLNDTNQQDFQQEWENNMLRSRYAREWDKWLHWWNDREVQILFDCRNNMGLLITSYLQQKKGDVLTFESFKAKCLHDESPYEAKQTFGELRQLQKRFEDAYNIPKTHNMIGAILRVFDKDNQKKFINHYFVEDKRDNLSDYYELVFLGMTHDEIVDKKKEVFKTKFDATFDAITDDFLYLNYKEEAFRFLLRLNVDQDIKQERFFNFQIWENGERSLEHIQPKSKVGHLVEGKWYDGKDEQKRKEDFTLFRDDIKAEIDNQTIRTTEHSIGNLVLLYKNENSWFNNSNYDEKKELFFSPNKKGLVRSRHLLHTICVFAEKKDWNGEAIVLNKIETIKKFETDYASLKTKFEYEKQD